MPDEHPQRFHQRGAVIGVLLRQRMDGWRVDTRRVERAI
jgi:hypothetical protein